MLDNGQVDLRSEHEVKAPSSISLDHLFHWLTGNIHVRNVYTENGLKGIQPRKLRTNSAPAIIVRSVDSMDVTEESNVLSLQNYADNCTNPRESKDAYNDSCEFVLEECQHKSELINYLAFVLCDFTDLQALAYVVMALWLIYLIALLASTVDQHFVPPLTFLSEKMKLTPGIAGITLLALGNGAPDIFVAFSGISQDDAALVLGSLSGGGIFVTTVVLGSVILTANLTLYKIDKIDFTRDLIAYMIVVGTIVAVSFDGVVYLVEALLFPALYFIYLGFAIGISYVRECYRKRKADETKDLLDEIVYYDEESVTNSLSNSIVLEPLSSIKRAEQEELRPVKSLSDNNSSVYFAGLTWPRQSNIIVKILWFLQLPFSLLRWITIPPFSHDGRWSIWHYLLASFSPIPISVLFLIAVKGWSGFTIYVNIIPLPVILVLISSAISLLLFCLLRPKRKPHWCIQIFLVPASFVTSIVWLNIIANEIVSILSAFGLLLHIDTAILGLTVLAIGNSVADLVANTVIARGDKPQMAFASCFGAPLLSHVVGLSLAIIVKILFHQYGEPFRFDISDIAYIPVKLSWIFLGLSLLLTAFAFPVCCFSPKRIYGVILLFLYLIFLIIIVLEETGILPVNF